MPPLPLLHSAAGGADGQVTTGGVVSTTVTLNEQLPVLLDESVAEQVTVVVPFGKVLPEAGVQVGVIDP